MKSILMLFAAALFLCSNGCGHGDGKKTGGVEKDRTYDIKGKVVSLDAAKKSVTLEHEDIPGLMKGMTMPFSVEDAKILEGIKAGDQVHGKLRAAPAYVILELHKTNAGAK